MSQQASSSFIASFDAMVKQAYQSAGVLSGTVREKKDVKGSTHKFFTMGKGLAQVRVPQTDVTPMNVSHGSATATLIDYSAPEYSDIYDLQKLSFDERKALAEVVAGAMGRRKDQEILDALASGANSTQVSEDLGGTNTGLNIEKILRAKRLMDAAGVPSSDRHMAISAYALEQALQETEIGSSDYNVLRPLVTGDIKTWGGFTFHMIEDRDEGGLTVTTNVRNNFAYHKDSVGIATGIDIRTEINYIPEKTSWLINGIFSAGAVVIDDAGAYDVLSYEA